MAEHKLDTDMAVPSNLDAVSEYYRNNLKHIIRKDSLTSSSETVSSIDSTETNNKINNAPQNDLKLNEISPQDRTHHLLSSSDTPLSYIHDDILYNQPSNINSIAVNSSNDVHFGHKINYNGPVTIKQQIVIRDEEGVRKASFTNGAFEGSQSDNNKSEHKNEKSPENVSDENIFKIFLISHWKKILIMFVLLLVVLASILLMIYLYKGDPPDIKIIPRAEWNALEPLERKNTYTSKPTMYVIAHTVTGQCLTKIDCMKQIQGIQRMHMDRNKQFKFDDIAYNFIVGGDGNVYEGRGWDEYGSHTVSYNSQSIGVAFIGDFRKYEPNDKQLKAGLALFSKGAKLGYVVEDYKIYAHCQLREFESPGVLFYRIIKTWKHWASDPNQCQWNFDKNLLE